MFDDIVIVSRVVTFRRSCSKDLVVSEESKYESEREPHDVGDRQTELVVSAGRKIENKKEMWDGGRREECAFASTRLREWWRWMRRLDSAAVSSIPDSHHLLLPVFANNSTSYCRFSVANSTAKRPCMRAKTGLDASNKLLEY